MDGSIVDVIDLEKLWEQYNMTDIQEKIGAMFPHFEFSLRELFQRVLSGDVAGALQDGIGGIFRGMAAEVGSIRNILLYLLVLGIVSALLSHFTDVFESHQIADISFYIVYLLLMAVLLKCFQEAAQTAGDAVENIVTFIKVFIPAYYLAVGVAGGAVTAYAGYQLLLFLIYGVEQVLLSVVMPLIYSFVMLAVINGIWSEERMAILLDFLQKCIGVILKTALGIVTGVSLLQSMVTPVIDSLKSQTLQKAVSAIPGIGNIADGVMETMVGSAVLIKNSIGVIFMILLLAVCLAPLVKIFLIAGCLKLSAALMGIVSDKRITGCTNKVGEGSFLLFRAAGTAMVLFIILIAIAAYTTNRGF